MVTHDHEEAFTVADRLAVMRAGGSSSRARSPRSGGRRSTPRPPCSSATPGCSTGAAARRAARGRRAAGRRRRSPYAARRWSSPTPGRCTGAVVSGRVTPEQIRLVVDVDGIGELDAVARLDEHPAPGDRVSLRGRRRTARRDA